MSGQTQNSNGVGTNDSQLLQWRPLRVSFVFFVSAGGVGAVIGRFSYRSAVNVNV